VRQRHVALGLRHLAAVVVPVLVVATVVPQLPPGYAWQRWVLTLPLLAWFLYGGLQPVLWWWGADLWADDAGVGFGQDRVRSAPAQVTFMARNRYRVPWSALGGPLLVTDRAAVKAMARAARAGTGAPQPSAFPGYFPVAGRALLVIRVDPAVVEVPAVRPASRRRSPVRLAERGLDPTVSTTWAFPVRDVEALTEALAARGVTVRPSADATLPTPTSGRG